MIAILLSLYLVGVIMAIIFAVGAGPRGSLGGWLAVGFGWPLIAIYFVFILIGSWMFKK